MSGGLVLWWWLASPSELLAAVDCGGGGGGGCCCCCSCNQATSFLAYPTTLSANVLNSLALGRVVSMRSYLISDVSMFRNIAHLWVGVRPSFRNWASRLRIIGIVV